MSATLADFTKKILRLNKRQFLIITDFNARWQLFLEHEKNNSTLIGLTESFIREPNEEKFEKIQFCVRTAEHQVIQFLRYISQENIPGSQSVIAEEEDADRSIEKILETDTFEIRRNINQLPNGQVKTALIEFLQDLEHEKEALQKEQKINTYLQTALQKLEEISYEEQTLFERELSLVQQRYNFDLKMFLSETESAAVRAEEYKTNFSAANLTLENIILELRNILEKEKGQVIDPYRVFTNQKAEVMKHILQRSQEKCITKKMIAEDLRSMSPLQAEQYLENLLRYFPNVEEKAVKFYMRFRTFFERKRKKAAYKEEDRLLAETVLLSRKANFDATMGIANKEFYKTALGERIEQTVRVGGTIGIMFFDLDYFKSVNDTYGHAIGDLILAIVGEITTESIEPGDNVCRIGGEEGAVIFGYKQNPKQILGIAERIRENIEKRTKEKVFLKERKISGEERLKQDLQSGERTITISAGVVILKLPRMKLTDEEKRNIRSILEENADRELYRAKKDGRNRVYSTNQDYQKL